MSFTSPTPPMAALRLDLGGVDRLGGRTEGGDETEALSDVGDVVVDGLRDADHADLQVPLAQSRRDPGGSAHRPVAADHEQDVDPVAEQAVDHLVGILGAPGRAEHGAALGVDVVDHVRSQPDRLQAAALDETRVPVPEAQHLVDAVVLATAPSPVRGSRRSTPDRVRRRSRHRPCVAPGGKNSRRRGPPGSKLGRSSGWTAEVGQLEDGVVEDDPVVLVDVVLVGAAVGHELRQRRLEPRLAQTGDQQVGEFGHDPGFQPCHSARCQQCDGRETRARGEEGAV